MFDTNHAHYAQHKIDAPSKPARHLIEAGTNNTAYETSDGLAFTIGVCVLESEIRRDNTVYKVQHPNGVDLYHIAYMPSGQILVTRVS